MTTPYRSGRRLWWWPYKEFVSMIRRVAWTAPAVRRAVAVDRPPGDQFHRLPPTKQASGVSVDATTLRLSVCNSPVDTVSTTPSTQKSRRRNNYLMLLCEALWLLNDSFWNHSKECNFDSKLDNCHKFNTNPPINHTDTPDSIEITRPDTPYSWFEM